LKSSSAKNLPRHLEVFLAELKGNPNWQAILKLLWESRTTLSPWRRLQGDTSWAHSQWVHQDGKRESETTLLKELGYIETKE